MRKRVVGLHFRHAGKLMLNLVQKMPSQFATVVVNIACTIDSG